ncbi:Os03g0788650 [Oryza sativa Japonica Group]|uniref:Os03g0788650 protein n=1 Tax=Oryza sativa subsp. japonica TaxID=39947 RepID=A0A0P0W408_ORYSJ|nr:hypothetical protein EE612_020898 [Oryza sativa]BAS86757.1 Os03g0788650 [Oryza sativa Japonica Group]
MKSFTWLWPSKWCFPEPGPGAGAGAMDGPGAMASQIGSTGGAPGGTGGAGFLRRCVLGSTSGAPVGSTAEMSARLRRRLKSSWTERGTRRRSIPWMTPSGLSTASGRVTAAWATRIAPSLAAAASSTSSPESVGWETADQDPEGRRAGRTWKRSSDWSDLRFLGSSRKRLNSGSRSRSSASFRGAKMVTLCLPTASSSVWSSRAFSTSSASSV